MDTYLNDWWLSDAGTDGHDAWRRKRHTSVGSPSTARTQPTHAHSRRDRIGAGPDLRLGPTDRILRQTGKLALGVRRNSGNDISSFDERPAQTCWFVAFQRSSVRLNIDDRKSEIVTANEVTFQNPGEASSRTALGPEGDAHDWIAIEPALLQEIVGQSPSLVSFTEGKLFPCSSAPINPRLFFEQHQLFSDLADPKNSIDTGQLERATRELIARIIEQAKRFWNQKRDDRSDSRPTCLCRRQQIVDAAKSILAREYWSDRSLGELSDMLHCSSAHLSRAFHAATGFKLINYRQELRLRKGLFLLEHRVSDIGDIAVHLGFASHSHFTSSFCRSFGALPSRFAKCKRGSTVAKAIL